MPFFKKERSLSQPHCSECGTALNIYSAMERTITDDKKWEGVSLKGGTERIFLCPGQHREKYEQQGYRFVGNFEWEQGMPNR